MNRIYRVIFNRKLGIWQVASEFSRGCRKSSGQGTKVLPALLLLSGSVFAADVPSIKADGFVAPGLPTDHIGTWDITGAGTVGKNAQNGTLTISNGAKVSQTGGDFSVGYQATGTLIVEGEGSSFSTTGVIQVAINGNLNGGASSVQVRNGAQLNAKEIRLAKAGNKAKLDVSGAGSSVEIEEGLIAEADNFQSRAEVLIADGGVITSKASVLGVGTQTTNSSNVRMEIKGAGSKFIVRDREVFTLRAEMQAIHMYSLCIMAERLKRKSCL